MNTNLDKIAQDLYGKIQTRFPSIKIGDENAKVLSKKEEIPQARFFEFEYKENGQSLGTVAITLDEDDGIVVQVSGDIMRDKHHSAFKFIRSFREFARNRLLNFDVQNIGKSNLDKRDYEYQAKSKEEQPMMESKMYGTSKLSYQDLGEARLVIKHSQPVNLDIAAGRTMHIESIYVENADGERFKYPFKHLNGARALAEHIKAGGNPYDSIGKHITSLSEELAQLRKFKGYVSRNENLAEAMGGITDVVFERIETIKKEVSMLQRPAYYAQFAESFEAREDEMIPEEIMNDLIDRLTIRTFNEDLKTAFPYIFRLVDESEIPVKELTADDLLAEKRTEVKDKDGKVVSWKEEGDWKKSEKKDPRGKVTNLSDKARRETEKLEKQDEAYDPLEAFESFVDSIVREDEEEGENTLFSPNKAVQQAAIEKLNQIIASELQGGPEGVNAIESLKGLIDDPEFLHTLKDADPDLDARPLIQQYILHNAPEIEAQLRFGGEGEVGGQDMDQPPVGTEPLAPPPEAAAPAPEAPPADATAVPPEAAPAAPAPIAENMNTSKLKAKFIQAKECGANLDTAMDFGHKTMTLHDAIRECGLTPMECGFEDPTSTGNGAHDILRSISGFWNPQEKNFTIGGTRAKTKIVKGFKDGEYPNASQDDLHRVLKMIEKMDPSTDVTHEHDRMKKLAGISSPLSHSGEMDEDQASDDFTKIMQQFMQTHQGADPGQMLDKFQKDHPDAKVTRNNTSSGTINGKPATYDDAVNQMKNMKLKFGDQEIDPTNPDAMKGQIGNMMKGMMSKAQSQAPNQNVQFPGGQMNPADMMKDIMGKINFGN